MTTLTSYTKSKVPLRSSSQHRYRLCCALRLKTAAVDTIAWGNFAKAMESSRIKKNTACQCLAVICQCHGVMTMTMIWQGVFQWWCCIRLDVRRVLSPTAKQYPGWSHENNDQLKGWRAEQQTIRSAGCGTWHQTPESRRKSDRIQHKKNLVSRQWIIKEHVVKDKLI